MAACLEQWRDAIVGCDDAGLPDQVRTIESVSRMVYSVMLDAVGELESRNIAVTAGFRNTKQLLAGMLNLSPTEAGTRVTHTGLLAPRRALTGEVLAPLLANTAAALAAGEIGPGQVRVITETINAIPTTVSPTDRDAAETELARHARLFHPTALHKIGQRILAHLDPDGPAPRDEPEPAPAAGELRLWERRDGCLGLAGHLEPVRSAPSARAPYRMGSPHPPWSCRIHPTRNHRPHPHPITQPTALLALDSAGQFIPTALARR